MDKVLAKVLAQSQGIPVTKFVYFSKTDLAHDTEKAIKSIEKALKYPLFVKPAHLGSSIGISRAKNKTELRNALEVAAHYDDRVLIEEAVQNLIEVTLPIMGNAEPKPALLERPLTAAEDFFDFETKYMQGGKKGGGKKGGAKGAQGYSELPAQLPKALYQKAEDVGLAVYKTLNCGGIARVDMLIDNKTKAVYFNEVNPMPGSLYAHNWNRAGVSNVELVRRLVAYAEERFNEQQQVTHTFNTNYLKQF
jgi:D-alanine-D-alanine ligase